MSRHWGPDAGAGRQAGQGVRGAVRVGRCLVSSVLRVAGPRAGPHSLHSQCQVKSRLQGAWLPSHGGPWLVTPLKS